MRNFLRNFLTNLPFIIFAIILAISVWVMAQLLRTQTISLTVPIQITNLPDDMVVTKMNTDIVKTTLQGKGYDFLQFYAKPPIYQIDLSLVRLGNNRIKLAPDDLIVSAPVLLKSIAPEFSEITIDQLESKQVVAIIPHRIEQKGFYITEITYQDSIILSGPEQSMRFVKDISSESLFISNYSTAPIRKKLKLVVPDTNLYKVTPESILITAIVEKESTRKFYDVTVKISPTDQDVTLKPKTASITLRGAKTLIDSLKTSDIKVNINTSKMTIGEYAVPAEISLPKGIFLVSCEPKMFEIKIR